MKKIQKILEWFNKQNKIIKYILFIIGIIPVGFIIYLIARYNKKSISIFKNELNNPQDLAAKANSDQTMQSDSKIVKDINIKLNDILMDMAK